MATRPARSTRAAAPVYTSSRRSSGGRADPAPRAHQSEDDVESSEDDGDQMDDDDQPRAASVKTITLAHMKPLPEQTRAQLAQHTATILQWREEAADGEEAAAMPAQLDTSCLASVLCSIPASMVRALYAVELVDEPALDELAGTIQNFLRYSDGGIELDNLIRTVRAWSARVRAEMKNEGQPEGAEDFWSILAGSSISPRNLVTFCFLLLTRAHSLVAFQAGALYLALIELAGLSRCLNLVANEMTLRAVQSLVRSWARQDARNKEAGCTRKKSRSSKKAPSAASADPFADESADGANEPDDSWLAAPEVTLFITDIMSSWSSLYTAASGAQPLLPLFKYAEVLQHLTDTLIDVTRTDVEASRRSRESVSPVASQAFDTLLALLHPSHSTVTNTFQALLKHALVSCVLAFGGGVSSATLPKHLLPVHRGSVVFVRRLIAHVRARALVDPGAVQLAVYHFLQHLMLRASDRADYRRTIAVACVRDILIPLADDGATIAAAAATPAARDPFPSLCTSFVGFVGRMVSNKRAGIRLMGLEVVEAALQQSWALEATTPTAAPAQAQPSNKFARQLSEEAGEEDEEEQKESHPGRRSSSGRPSLQPGASIDLSNSMLLDASFEVDSEEGLPHAATLLSLLVRRCSDSSAVVRAKALTALAHVLDFCSTTYGPQTASATQRAAFCRTMRQRMTVAGAAAASAPNTPGLQRSASAPSQEPVTPTTAVQFSFLHTPLTTRSRSEFLTPSLNLSHLVAGTGSAFHPSLPGVRDMLAVLYRRAGDEKAVVRRAAIQALECILVGAAAEDETAQMDASGANASDVNMSTPGAAPSFNVSTSFSVLSSLTASDLQIFYDGCFDRSLSIRKQSLASLTSLLRQFRSADSSLMPESAKHARMNLQKIWLGAVLPLVQDQEKGVVDKCIEAVAELLLEPIARALHARHAKQTKAARGITDGEVESVWTMFGQLDAEMTHYLAAVFVLQLKAGQVSNEFIRDLLKEAEANCGSASSAVESAAEAEDETTVSRSRATWVLLECVCHFSSTVAASIDLTRSIGVAWSRVTQSGWQVEEATLLRLLSCVGHLAHAGRWKTDRIVEYAGYLFHVLTEQVSASCKKPSTAATSAVASPELIKKQIWILNSLCAALNTSQASEPTASQEKLPAWESELLIACEKQLETYLAVAASLTVASGSSISSSSAWNEPGLMVLLFTLGELVLQHQTYDVKRTVTPGLLTLVQTFIAPTMHLAKKKGRYGNADVTMEDSSLDLSQSSTATASSHANADMLTLSASVRAHAFLTLGKFCLRNELLAKRCVMLFIGELEAAAEVASPLIQNNVLLVLCDLCRTFTAIVDPYLPSITAMLSSRNTLLRKHTIMVLNVLLQEEYLKMKSSAHITGSGSAADDELSVQAQHSGSSSMFYRYLRCLVDEDAGIRQLVQVSLKAILAKQSSGSAGGAAGAAGAAAGGQSTRIHMHFVELIFFLNQCHEHPLYNQFSSGGNKSRTKTSANDAPFGLVGALGTPAASKRFVLYRYCLGLLTDEQKFILMGKLHTEVLQAVNEESFLTSPWHTGLRTADVVQDALIILASEAMQLGGGSKRDASAEGVEGELQEMAMAAEESGEGSSAPKSAAGLASLHAQQAAKAKLLHRLLKKSTIEACMPILFELRASFARTHSPLAQWLHFYFSVLLQQYKAEMSEVFAGNKLLEREVLYDLKRWADQEPDQLDQQTRWKQMDFTPRVEKKAAVSMTPPAVLGPMSSAAGAAPDSVSRRLSLGQSNGVQSTPLKPSSLAALRVAATPMSASRGGVVSLQSPLLRRTFSTPAGAGAAASPSQTTPTSLRTPGAIATPTLLRRTHSTPSSATTKRVTRRRASGGGALAPSRLVEGAEPESEGDGSDNALTDLDSSDSEGDEENRRATGNLIVLPAPEDDAGHPTKPRNSDVWNVAVPGAAADSDDDAADQSMTDQNEEEVRPQATKKARTTRATQPPPASALERLSIGGASKKAQSQSKKRKSAPANTSPAAKQKDDAATESPSIAANRPKRKASGLR